MYGAACDSMPLAKVDGRIPRFKNSIWITRY
jgi:hypothetical protein